MNLSTRPSSSTKPEQERPRGPRLTPCSAAKGQACPPRPGATREHRLSRWLLHTRRRPSQSSCARKRRSRWERRRGRPYLLMAWSCRWKSHRTLATRAERRIQQGGGEQNQGTNITPAAVHQPQPTQKETEKPAPFTGMSKRTKHPK